MSAAIVAAATLGMGVTPASASSAPTDRDAQSTAALEGTATAAGWAFHSDYWTYDGCIGAGERGKQRSEWIAYQCNPSGIDWNLWVLYP